MEGAGGEDYIKLNKYFIKEGLRYLIPPQGIGKDCKVFPEEYLLFIRQKIQMFCMNISLYRSSFATNMDGNLYSTLAPKSFDYQFMATLHWRGQGIQNEGDNKRGGEGDTNVTRIITRLKAESPVIQF